MNTTKWSILLFAILLFVLIFGDAYHPISGIQLIPLSITGVIAGMIVESARLTDKWIDILLTVVGGLVLSFLFALPGKSYNFAEHIKSWPYVFIFCFSIIALLFHGKLLIPKLTEGITLTQSIAIIYWLVDKDLFSSESKTLKVFMIIGIGFSIYSFIHALSYIRLSPNSRFILSLWSSVIMLLFGIDNLYGIYQSDSIEHLTDTWEKIYEWFSYFFLGISSVYMIKNLLLLSGFLPEKGKFFNRAYFRSIRKLKIQHISRYSENQVKLRHSIICIVLSASFFSVNYYYQFLPSHTAIWILFFLVPFVIELSEKMEPKENNERQDF